MLLSFISVVAIEIYINVSINLKREIRLIILKAMQQMKQEIMLKWIIEKYQIESKLFNISNTKMKDHIPNDFLAFTYGI